mmetsp:Transcript_69825/g.209764  ORF Transcript_69825/g.209764 Transcript_69825/m.209764 type:complete len:235 (-) Transcript_69825:95-799(-)
MGADGKIPRRAHPVDAWRESGPHAGHESGGSCSDARRAQGSRDPTRPSPSSGIACRLLFGARFARRHVRAGWHVLARRHVLAGRHVRLWWHGPCDLWWRAYPIRCRRHLRRCSSSANARRRDGCRRLWGRCYTGHGRRPGRTIPDQFRIERRQVGCSQRGAQRWRPFRSRRGCVVPLRRRARGGGAQAHRQSRECPQGRGQPVRRQEHHWRAAHPARAEARGCPGCILCRPGAA